MPFHQTDVDGFKSDLFLLFIFIGAEPPLPE